MLSYAKYESEASFPRQRRHPDTAMLQDRLNDAAIALSRVLSDARIKFGIFGGYAIAVLGGQRESKDIDCVAALLEAGGHKPVRWETWICCGPSDA